MALVPGQNPIQPATKPRLYLVATSHLDTQWRWTIQTTIRHFLRRTLLDNFERMRSSPGYVLSFEGAFRYQLAEEYYPKEFQELLRLVREKRWRPAGAMLDAPDTILPSPESLIRHILYGNGYFEAKLGCRCVDLFLPDCFGFPWSLPTVGSLWNQGVLQPETGQVEVAGNDPVRHRALGGTRRLTNRRDSEPG